MDKKIKFASNFYKFSGIYGILVLFPQYFMETKNGIDFPPVINHPEYYYGFIGVALAWQILFFILATDPLKYRLMMLPTMLEKASWGFACIVLYLQNKLHFLMLIAGFIDLFLMIGFIISFRLLKEN